MERQILEIGLKRVRDDQIGEDRDITLMRGVSIGVQCLHAE
jgi:hypothetical protein